MAARWLLGGCLATQLLFRVVAWTNMRTVVVGNGALLAVAGLLKVIWPLASGNYLETSYGFYTALAVNIVLSGPKYYTSTG